PRRPHPALAFRRMVSMAEGRSSRIVRVGSTSLARSVQRSTRLTLSPPISSSSNASSKPSGIPAGLTWGRKHLDGVTFHTFRHTRASLAINNGVPEDVVQGRGNGRNREMVSRYGHMSDDRLRAGVARLDEVVAKTGGPPAVRVNVESPAETPSG